MKPNAPAPGGAELSVAVEIKKDGKQIAIAGHGVFFSVKEPDWKPPTASGTLKLDVKTGEKLDVVVHVANRQGDFYGGVEEKGVSAIVPQGQNRRTFQVHNRRLFGGGWVDLEMEFDVRPPPELPSYPQPPVR